MATEIAYAKEKYDAIERLHANSRARGMSDAAIAKLPKLPVYVKPIELPPVVLATTRNGAFPAMKNSTRTALRRHRTASGRWSGGGTDIVLKGLVVPHIPPATVEEKKVRAREIAILTAEVNNINITQVMGRHVRDRPVTLARHMGVALAAVFTKLSWGQLSLVFMGGGVNSYFCRNAVQRIEYRLDMEDHAAEAVLRKAIDVIRQRFPEYWL